MDSSARREKILQILQESSSAVTGTTLSKACNVSRQIIVGDVAILRAQGIAIISTPRGYQLVVPAAPGCMRVFVCCHGSDLMEAELNAIVDNGGIVHNVVIEHDVYGNLEGTLNLHSRRDIQQYIKRMHDSHAEMLSTISGGIHTHLVEPATEEELDAIGQALRDVGVLYKD